MLSTGRRVRLAGSLDILAILTGADGEVGENSLIEATDIPREAFCEALGELHELGLINFRRGWSDVPVYVVTGDGENLIRSRFELYKTLLGET